MDSDLQNLLFREFEKEVENVIISDPEFQEDVKVLLLVDLDDDSGVSSGTESGFGSPTYSDGTSSSSYSIFDFDEDLFDLTPDDPSTMVMLSDSPILSDNIVNFEDSSREFKVECKEERDIETESSSSITSASEYYDTFVEKELQEEDVQTYSVAQQQQEHSEPMTPEVFVVSQPIFDHAGYAKKVTNEATVGFPKPDLSFPCLSALAIKNSPEGKLLVTQIYTFLCEHFPYFQMAPKGWKNALRHSLSHSTSFEKIETCTVSFPNKRSSLWTVTPAKAAKMDEQLRKKSAQHSQNLREAMSHPEHLDLMLRGEMKIGAKVGLADKEYDFMSQFMQLPSAKRRRTADGEAQTLRVYQSAKRRKVITRETIDVAVEE